MNKLEQKHLDIFEESKSWKEHYSEPLWALNDELASTKSAELTKDIAIKFGAFCRNLSRWDKDILRNNPDITEEGLFNKFLETYFSHDKSEFHNVIDYS